MICAAHPAFGNSNKIGNLSRSFPSTTLPKLIHFPDLSSFRQLKHFIKIVIDSSQVALAERRLNNRQAISHLLDFTDRYFPLCQLFYHPFFFWRKQHQQSFTTFFVPDQKEKKKETSSKHEKISFCWCFQEPMRIYIWFLINSPKNEQNFSLNRGKRRGKPVKWLANIPTWADFKTMPGVLNIRG